MSLLEGYTVIELAGVLAGPSAGQFLAELGAEVIKVENLLTNGDVTRKWKTPKETSANDITAYFASANWGKKSIALNLASEGGRNVIYNLVGKADIVISSYKKGDDKKLGMDPLTLSTHNPGIIYAHISGYGENDPKVAYDAMLQAESGFMSMNGTEVSGPLKMPVALIDILAAHQVKEAILGAIIRKLKTGKGSMIEVSLMDSALISLANQATNYLFTGNIPGLQGSIHPNIAPYGETFKTRDNETIVLAIGTDKQFQELCRILGINVREEFISNKARLKNRKQLYQVLKEHFANQNATEFLQDCELNSIPAGKVKNIEEALKGSKSIIYDKDGYSGLKQAVFIEGNYEISPPPHFGEHTSEILENYGFSSLEIEELRKKNIIS
jgi:crotonobetainyl-CoA:carnitine CoA-transferase CaiB-like acyl-CoA transferase